VQSGDLWISHSHRATAQRIDSHESNDACNSLPAALLTACDAQNPFECMCMAERRGGGEHLFDWKQRKFLIDFSKVLMGNLQFSRPVKIMKNKNEIL